MPAFASVGIGGDRGPRYVRVTGRVGSDRQWDGGKSIDARVREHDGVWPDRRVVHGNENVVGPVVRDADLNSFTAQGCACEKQQGIAPARTAKPSLRFILHASCKPKDPTSMIGAFLRIGDRHRPRLAVRSLLRRVPVGHSPTSGRRNSFFLHAAGPSKVRLRHFG